MKKEEFIAALKELGFSQRKFAAITGMSRSAIHEWANDKAKIPPIAAAYVRLRLDIQRATS